MFERSLENKEGQEVSRLVSVEIHNARVKEVRLQG